MRTLKNYIYLILLFILTQGSSVKHVNTGNPIYFTKEHKTINKTEYLIISPDKARIDFETARPSKNDKNILLCVAGAYTSLKTQEVDGLHISKGKLYHKNKINSSLDGGIKIINNKVEIFSTQRGQILNDSFLKTITDNNGIFFQQTLCMQNSQVIKFTETKLFQRRGIVVLKNGGYAIVESSQAITIQKFANDMLSLGAKELLNFDMGAWDEGWYRDPSTNQITTLGKNRTQTNKQSNWVILRK